MRRLEKARENNRTTLTGEIISRLERSFQPEDQAELIGKTVIATANATGLFADEDALHKAISAFSSKKVSAKS